MTSTPKFSLGKPKKKKKKKNQIEGLSFVFLEKSTGNVVDREMLDECWCDGGLIDGDGGDDKRVSNFFFVFPFCLFRNSQIIPH